MVTVGDVARPLASVCTTVPPIGSGICRLCHGVPNPGYSTCYSCGQVERQLSRPCSLVLPVSLYTIPSQLHDILRHYKSGSYSAQRQDQFTVQAVCILSHFVLTHRPCIAAAAGKDWEILTTVPSTSGRTGRHPLAAAIGRVAGFREQFEELLAPGAVPTTHVIASDQGFTVTRPVNGKRVLIVDDTFTSGARAQSAASALTLAGALVVAIVPIGRVIQPGWSPDTQAYWTQRGTEPFDFNVCCLEPTLP